MWLGSKSLQKNQYPSVSYEKYRSADLSPREKYLKMENLVKENGPSILIVELGTFRIPDHMVYEWIALGGRYDYYLDLKRSYDGLKQIDNIWIAKYISNRIIKEEAQRNNLFSTKN